MKILHVIPGVDLGGTESQLLRLINQTSEQYKVDHDVAVLMAPGVLSNSYEQAVGLMEYLGVRGFGSLPRAIARLSDFINLSEPDIIQGWLYHGNILALLASFRASRGRIPVAWNIRQSINSFRSETWNARASILSSIILSRFPDAIVNNSFVSEKQHIKLGFPKSKCIRIANGINTTEFQSKKKRSGNTKKVVFGRHSRWHPIKGFDDLLKAWKIAQDLDQNIFLELMGCGLDDPIHSLMGRHGIDDKRVTIRTQTTDVREWLDQIDVYIASSLAEGFPNALLEAMSFQKPCITTDVGDSSLCLESDDWVVQPGDYESMSSLIVRMAGLTADQRTKLGNENRNLVNKNFSMDQIAQQYFQLWNSLAS